MKKYQDFVDEKWVLRTNEGLFDKIESMVKGQSNKGKIIKQLLDKNGIKEVGDVISVNWVGGSDPGKTELSNPIDYLHYQPNICKIDVNGNLIILDEKSKNLKVPDVVSFMAVANKSTVEGTGPGQGSFMLFKVGSVVSKSSYKFDLSIEIPTITIDTLNYSIIKQNWIDDGNKSDVINLDDDITEFENDIISFKTPMNIIILQKYVDNINNHPKKTELINYLVNTIGFKSDKPATIATTPETPAAEPSKPTVQPTGSVQTEKTAPVQVQPVDEPSSAKSV